MSFSWQVKVAGKVSRSCAKSSIYGKQKWVNISYLKKTILEFLNTGEFPFSLLVPCFKKSTSRVPSYIYLGIWDIDIKDPISGRVYLDEDLEKNTEFSKGKAVWHTGGKGVRIWEMEEEKSMLKFFFYTGKKKELHDLQSGVSEYWEKIWKDGVVHPEYIKFIDKINFENRGVKFDFLPHPTTKKLPHILGGKEDPSIIALIYYQFLERVENLLLKQEDDIKQHCLKSLESIPLILRGPDRKSKEGLQKRNRVISDRLIEKRDLYLTKYIKNLPDCIESLEFHFGCSIVHIRDNYFSPATSIPCPIHSMRVHERYSVGKIVFRVKGMANNMYIIVPECKSSRKPSIGEGVVQRILVLSRLNFNEDFYTRYIKYIISPSSRSYFLNSKLRSVIQINEKYLPSRDVFKDGPGIYIISSTMGSGKTSCILKMIERERLKKVIWISMRITFTLEITKKKFNGIKDRFKSYKEIRSSEELKRIDYLVISPESLHKIAPITGKYDAVIVDEFSSLVSNYFSSTMDKNRIKTIALLNHLFISSSWTVLSDACITDMELQAVFRIPKINTSKISFVYNENYDVDRSRYFIYDSFSLYSQWYDNLERDVREGKNIAICSTSRNRLLSIVKYILVQRCSIKQSEILVITGDTDIQVKNKFMSNLNEELPKFRFFCYTQAITIGNSFDKRHFHSVYSFISDMATDLTMDIQMLRRVREPIDSVVHILFDYHFKPCLPYGYWSSSQDCKLVESPTVDESLFSRENIAKTIKTYGIWSDGIAKNTIHQAATLLELKEARECVAKIPGKKKADKYIMMCRTLDSMFIQKENMIEEVEEEEEEGEGEDITLEDYLLDLFIYHRVKHLFCSDRGRKKTLFSQFMLLMTGKPPIYLDIEQSGDTRIDSSREYSREHREWDKCTASDFEKNGGETIKSKALEGILDEREVEKEFLRKAKFALRYEGDNFGYIVDLMKSLSLSYYNSSSTSGALFSGFVKIYCTEEFSNTERWPLPIRGSEEVAKEVYENFVVTHFDLEKIEIREVEEEIPKIILDYAIVYGGVDCPVLTSPDDPFIAKAWILQAAGIPTRTAYSKKMKKRVIKVNKKQTLLLFNYCQDTLGYRMKKHILINADSRSLLPGSVLPQ